MTVRKFTDSVALGSGFRFMSAGQNFGWQRPGPVFEKDDGAGLGSNTGEGANSGDNNGADDGNKQGKQEPSNQGQPKPSDGEAKLLKEVMKLKNSLKEREEALSRYGDVDADTVKSMLEEKKQKDAELKAAEEKRLRDAGDFDALKKSMSEQHARELKAQIDALQAERDGMSKLQRTIEELTVGQSFGNSSFLRDETLLTPAKARKLYGEYFDTENGVVKPYNKERGQDGREPLVTSSGEPLSFDEAMKRIIEADPDRERLLRSKAKQGTGAMPSPGKTQAKSNDGPGFGVNRISAALNKMR